MTSSQTVSALAGAILALSISQAHAEPLSLLGLYEHTLASHPVLKGREYAIDQAAAEKDQVLAKLLPQIAAVGNLSWNDMTQLQQSTRTVVRSGRLTSVLVSEAFNSTYEGTRGIVQARQALFDLPSILRLQGARAAMRQTEQDLEAARMAVAADLIDRYFQALEATDEIGYVRGEQALTEAELKRIRKMRERQLAPVTDLYEVEAYAQALQTKELEAQNARAVALEKLRETSGVPVPDIAVLQRDELPTPPGEVDRWVNDAVRHHPALMSLQYAEESARKMIASARAEHLPQVSLQASETYADNGGFDNRQLPRYNVGSVGLQLNVPIFSGGGIEAAARGATAQYQITQEKRTEKLREVERETRTAWLNAQSGRARIDATTKEVEARTKARDAQDKSYQLGVATIAALLESKKNLLKAQVEQSKSRYDYIRALVALRLWAGSLTQKDVEDIDSWLR
jgi:outer membrane protein